MCFAINKGISLKSFAQENLHVRKSSFEEELFGHFVKLLHFQATKMTKSQIIGKAVN